MFKEHLWEEPRGGQDGGLLTLGKSLPSLCTAVARIQPGLIAGVLPGPGTQEVFYEFCAGPGAGAGSKRLEDLALTFQWFPGL